MSVLLRLLTNPFLFTFLLGAVLMDSLLGVVEADPVPGVTSKNNTLGPKCLLSQLPCNNGKCVSINKYCDGINHCGDNTDEPPHCTPCNRTYYGEKGKTYDLELHRPKEEKLPYVCHLTIKAGGGVFGDIIQVTFERFTLGRFMSFISDGCPDGSMTIQEASRSPIGGSWCGSSWGPVLYFSETNSLTLAVVLTKLSTNQNGYNFDFKITYKVLSKPDAVVRFGGPPIKPPELDPRLEEEVNSIEYSPFSNLTFRGGSGSGYLSGETVSSIEKPEVVDQEYFLGNRIGATYCSRMFSDCDRKPCRLQSPNFPGVYPRNLTCYFAVRQQSVPVGKHALISVYQPEAQMINIRSQAALYARPTQATNNHLSSLKVWNDCDEVQDYVTVYDGYTTRDPVLLKFCGGGSPVPKAVSSGPELLVEFATSPFGTFLYPAPPPALHGFQLLVDVEYVDRDEPLYTRNKRCEFWISGTGHGVLESPHNTVAKNTTCLYHLWGAEPGTTPLPRPHPRPPSRYRVWISILKYHVAETTFPTTSDESKCATSLKVWDGTIKSATTCTNDNCDDGIHRTLVRPNVQLLARYCKDQIPRTCDHHMFRNNSRPCTMSESFLSTGDTATLELTISEATALKPVSFRALYEFVDLHQDGEQFGTGKCSRLFSSRHLPPSLYYTTHHFASPRNIFFFGRGGAQNLSCTYRFEAQKGERVRITITNLRMGNRSDCETHNEGGWGRLQCSVATPSASVQFWEIPYSKISLPKDCLCANSDSLLPFIYTSKSHILETRLIISNMTSEDDYRNLGFEATWEFVRRPVCTRSQKLNGPSGEVIFTAPSRTPEEVNCEGKPWVIEPTDSRYLYVKVTGVVVGGTGKTGVIRQGQCATSNRIEIHAGTTHVIVCPQPLPAHQHNVVEVFSDGWVIGNQAERLPPGWSRADRREARNIVVEFTPREDGSYTVTWLELTRRRSEMHWAGLMGDCPHRCPELDACINATLWCDGTYHCPSGYDESFTHCLPLPPIQFALLCIIVISAISLLVTLFCRTRRHRRRHLKSLPSDTDTIMSSSAGKEVIC